LSPTLNFALLTKASSLPDPSSSRSGASHSSPTPRRHNTCFSLALDLGLSLFVSCLHFTSLPFRTPHHDPTQPTTLEQQSAGRVDPDHITHPPSYIIHHPSQSVGRAEPRLLHRGVQQTNEAHTNRWSGAYFPTLPNPKRARKFEIAALLHALCPAPATPAPPCEPITTGPEQLAHASIGWFGHELHLQALQRTSHRVSLDRYLPTYLPTYLVQCRSCFCGVGGVLFV
jgi:hypothetical protein